MKGGPNVTRMDYSRTHGWWVRIYRHEGGAPRCHSKYFGDGSHGGKRKALLAARAWREDCLRRLPPPATSGGRRVPPGYGYVRRTKFARRTGKYPVMMAWVRLEDGRAASTSYSVSRWGEGGAFDKAQAWLDERVRELKRRRRAGRVR